MKGKLEHQATGFGENVYWNAQMPLPSRPPEAWYAEIKDFDWDNVGGQPGTGINQTLKTEIGQVVSL